MQLGIAPGDEVVTVPDKAVTIIERDQGHWSFPCVFSVFRPAREASHRSDRYGTLYPRGRLIGVKGCEISQHV
jgi:hypothetical protein